MGLRYVTLLLHSDIAAFQAAFSHLHRLEQLTGIIFMPENGALFEIFPLGYVLEEYFGSLATPIGLEYAYIFETNGNPAEEKAYWTANIERRRIARRKNLCLSIPKIVKGVKLLVTNWKNRQRDENITITSPLRRL